MGVEWFGIALSFATAAAALIYARQQAQVSRAQLEAETKARREALEPHVIVYFEFVPRLFNLVVENIGTSVARNVHIHVTPQLTSVAETKGAPRLADVGFLKNGIPSLAPKQRLATMVDLANERHASDLPDRYTFTITADGPFGPVEPLTCDLDVSVIHNTTYLDRKTIHDAVIELTKIRTELTPTAPRQRPSVEPARDAE